MFYWDPFPIIGLLCLFVGLKLLQLSRSWLPWCWFWRWCWCRLYNVEFSAQPPLPPRYPVMFFCGEGKSASQPILSIYAASIKGRPAEKAAKTVLLRGTIKLEYDHDHQARAMTEPARSVVANMTLVSSCLFFKMQSSWYFWGKRQSTGPALVFEDQTNIMICPLPMSGRDCRSLETITDPCIIISDFYDHTSDSDWSFSV